jgi:antitoxin Phd
MNKKRQPKRWQLQEAKAKFSEVFDRALTEGPQYVSRRNKDEVVVMPAKEYATLTGRSERPTLVEALLACPKGPELRIERNKKDVVGRGERPVFKE